MAKDKSDKKRLTAKEFEALLKVKKDPFFFSEFIYVVHPIRGKVHFHLYPYQKSVLWNFLNNRFNIILKFRQAGITELISMYCLWLAMYHPNKTIVIISIKDRVAKKVLKKIKYMYKNLPDYLKIDIVNGRSNEFGTACISGDTKIISENQNIMIDSISPLQKGVINIEHLGLKVLTQSGKYKRILHTVNKGELETWEIKNNKGEVLKCTPEHKLYTTKGWLTVKEIIDNNYKAIFFNKEILTCEEAPKTIKPSEEIILESKYLGYYVSNIGKIYSKRRGNLYELKTKKTSHERVKLRAYNKFESVHRLVWETFNGDIPDGYVIDHINCNRFDNYLTNLQCITYSENTLRAHKYNKNLKISHHTNSNLSTLEIGILRELDEKLDNGYGSNKLIADRLNISTKRASQYRRNKNLGNIYLSNLEVITKCKEVIYDLEVEDEHNYITENGYINHNTDMEFSNGSVISSVPTTEDAGRSEAVTLLVIDEAAIVRWANQIWAAAFPTLSTGGASIVNSCITGDTEIVGRHGNFRVEQVCPKEFGAQDIRFMNLEVLTHKLQWKRAIYGINKGNLETWEIKNNKGKIIKCTPAHKFLTTNGWKSAQEVIEKGLYVILYEPGNSKLEEPPITVPPKKEIRVEVKGFPNYLISNLGKIYSKETGKEKESRLNKAGYKRIKLWNGGGNNKTFHISKLVAQHFIGNIPDDYVVDHINCNPLDNYSTNLQIITTKENSQRAHRFSRGLTLNTSTGKGASDVSLVGYIKYLHQVEGLNGDNIIAKVYKKFNKIINRSYVSRIVNNNRNKNITISQLEVLRKYSDTIYDITVEDDSSYLTDTEYINHNTPYGVGNWYHQTWVDAVSGGNEFNPIRLRWDMHPERDIEWYNSMASSLGPRRTAQEIDGDFLTSGHSVFDLSSIKAIEDMISEYRVIEQRFEGKLRIFSKPKKGESYYIGADVSTGRAQDYSTFSIMDRQGEEVGCFKGKLPTNEFAKLLIHYGYMFNTATLAPETNDVGLAVTSDIQTANYPNLYYSSKILRKKGKSKPETEDIPGWLTTSKNRSLIIDELEDDIRNENIIVKDPFFVQEAYTFIYDATNRPVALGKNKKSKGGEEEEGQTYTDDSIMAKAITNFIRKGKKKTIIIAPK